MCLRTDAFETSMLRQRITEAGGSLQLFKVMRLTRSGKLASLYMPHLFTRPGIHVATDLKGREVGLEQIGDERGSTEVRFGFHVFPSQVDAVKHMIFAKRELQANAVLVPVTGRAEHLRGAGKFEDEDDISAAFAHIEISEPDYARAMTGRSMQMSPAALVAMLESEPSPAETSWTEVAEVA